MRTVLWAYSYNAFSGKQNRISLKVFSWNFSWENIRLMLNLEIIRMNSDKLVFIVALPLQYFIESNQIVHLVIYFSQHSCMLLLY